MKEVAAEHDRETDCGRGETTADQKLRRWKRDPVAFVTEVLRDPETSRPFELYPAEVRFLREALTVTKDGRLPYPEMLFSAPKKSGKTALAAMGAIYAAVVIGGPFAEVYALANDFEQASSRVFQAAARIIEASPQLRGSAKITSNRIEFTSTGSFIQACASDYSGFAGANPTLTICDELWGFVHESSRRLFDEAVPSPARKVSGRLTVTYAGFTGESELLEGLYKRGLSCKRIGQDLYARDGMLCYWTHKCRAPWQTKSWIEQMSKSLRTNQFLRMIQNQWVTSESSFVPLASWDACVDPAVRPIVADRTLAVWVGVDASVKRDNTAVVACTWDAEAKGVRLVFHRTWQPSKNDPLDFERTVEAALLELRDKFDLREVRYDPYQMQASAQRLQRAGVPMVEFPQTPDRLTQAGTNLSDLIKGRNFVAYPDADMRLAISRAVALETGRGVRLAKEKASHKIDVVAALSFAALGAATAQGTPAVVEWYKLDLARSHPDQGPDGVARCANLACSKPLDPEKCTTLRGKKFCSTACAAPYQ
jgi:phage terminase large subunit-like protein